MCNTSLCLFLFLLFYITEIINSQGTSSEEKYRSLITKFLRENKDVKDKAALENSSKQAKNEDVKEKNNKAGNDSKIIYLSDKRNKPNKTLTAKDPNVAEYIRDEILPTQSYDFEDQTTTTEADILPYDPHITIENSPKDQPLMAEFSLENASDSLTNYQPQHPVATTETSQFSSVYELQASDELHDDIQFRIAKTQRNEIPGNIMEPYAPQYFGNTKNMLPYKPQGRSGRINSNEYNSETGPEDPPLRNQYPHFTKYKNMNGGIEEKANAKTQKFYGNIIRPNKHKPRILYDQPFNQAHQNIDNLNHGSIKTKKNTFLEDPINIPVNYDSSPQDFEKVMYDNTRPAHPEYFREVVLPPEPEHDYYRNMMLPPGSKTNNIQPSTAPEQPPPMELVPELPVALKHCPCTESKTQEPCNTVQCRPLNFYTHLYHNALDRLKAQYIELYAQGTILSQQNILQRLQADIMAAQRYIKLINDFNVSKKILYFKPISLL